MESSLLASWQFEYPSTAELSPPVSPVSPSSPLFYDGSNPSSPSGAIKANTYATTNKMTLQQSQKPALGMALSSRAQVATNMLNELERLHYVENQSAFGMGQNEESVDLNMDLFEELRDIEFTPPLSVLAEYEVPNVRVASPVPVASPSVVVAPPTSDAEVAAKFTAEYKSILESLNNASKISAISGNTSSSFNNNGVNHFGSLFQVAGIPTTTVVGDECLVPVEFVGRPSMAGGIGAEEAESMDLDGIIISDDLGLVNESELFSLGVLSAELDTEENSIAKSNATVVNGVLPYWAQNMTVPLDALDAQMNKNADTLDALLKGDVSAAKSVLSPGYTSPVSVQEAFSPVSHYSSENEDDDSILVAETIAIVEPEAEVEVKKKTERRGRKPAKYNKNSLVYVKDKVLRKKEQNKTAATRYRLKKKQELACTLAEEDDLQEVHDELSKQKQKLGSEISVIRSLLREMLSARKQRISPASAATASSIVQAQRIVKIKGRK